MSIYTNIVWGDRITCCKLKYPASAHARVAHQLFQRVTGITDRGGWCNWKSRKPSDELFPSNHIVPIVVFLCINGAVCNEFVNVLAAESRKASHISYGKRLMGDSCFPSCVQTIVWIVVVFFWNCIAYYSTCFSARLYNILKCVHSVLCLLKRKAIGMTYFLKNSLGVRPKCFLNTRVKCCGYSKPRISEVSEMVFPSWR